MKHIAFDLGAESGRAIVGEIVKGKLETEELHRFPTEGTYVNNSLRWDIYRLFEELKTGIKEYADRYGQEPCTMGVDTWGVDFGFLDKNGRLCSIPYHYRDKRNRCAPKIIEETLGFDRLYELTGVQQLDINSLNQIIAAKESDDQTLKIGDKLLFIGDLLHYFLCGEAKAEYTISTTSNLYNTIDSRWENAVFDAFDIDKRIQPEIIKAGEILGDIRKDLALETGVSEECKIIVPAVHDTASAAAAVPGFSETIAYISSGTWSLVGLELDNALINNQTMAQNIANYGGALDKILFLKNVMGLWLIQQSRKQWLKENKDLGYGDIVKKAEKAEAFFGFINPDDRMFLNPENMTVAVCEYLKKTGQRELDPNNIGQVARIIFECLALKYRKVFELLKSASGKSIDILNIIGGGIQNEMLTQFTANAMGVKVVAGPVEGTASGNILLQAYGSKEINSLEEIRRVVANTFELKEYFPADNELWNSKFEEFADICNS